MKVSIENRVQVLHCKKCHRVVFRKDDDPLTPYDKRHLCLECWRKELQDEERHGRNK